MDTWFRFAPVACQGHTFGRLLPPFGYPCSWQTVFNAWSTTLVLLYMTGAYRHVDSTYRLADIDRHALRRKCRTSSDFEFHRCLSRDRSLRGLLREHQRTHSCLQLSLRTTELERTTCSSLDIKRSALLLFHKAQTRLPSAGSGNNGITVDGKSVWRKTNLLWFDCSDTIMTMQQPTQAQRASSRNALQ